MTQDDILRMAREAGLTTMAHDSRIARFASLAVAAQREKVAHWMRSLGYATGHGDTIEDLLDHLGTQISEGLEAEKMMEREACAKVCEGPGWNAANWCAAAIRARSKT
jgi:hypothetical protein